MYAIFLIFVVSFNLVSSDVANAVQVQQLLERVNVLERKLEKVNLVERKLERVDVLEMKLATLSNAYEMLLEDRHGQSQCNCSDLEEDIRDIGIIAAKNRHNILVNNDMIQKNVDKIDANFELHSGLLETTNDEIEVNEERIQVNTNSITVRLF